MNYSIEVNDLSKRYRKGRGLTNLRELLSFRQAREADQYHWAVRDVSFALKRGEALGIIGPNGAGKTTILKLLSNVTKPTSGTVSVSGRFSALIELGAGFHPDLTGRENIFLNGAILGMKRDEIQHRFDEIIDFAGIGDYLDTPVKRYSSGMYARLGFAIAAHIDPDVLLVDEVLAVGDYAFQRKCYARMDELRKNGTALIFVSHNFEAVQRVCDRCMVMYQGADVFQGPAPDAVAAYSARLRDAAKVNRRNIPKEEEGATASHLTFDAEILDITMCDADGNTATHFTSGATAQIHMDMHFHQTVSRPALAIVIRTTSGVRVFVTSTLWLGIETPNFHAGERFRATFSLKLSLVDGIYEVGGNIRSADGSGWYDHVEQALTFVVANGGWPHRSEGIADLSPIVTLYPNGEWRELNTGEQASS